MTVQPYTLAVTQGSTLTLSCSLAQAGVAFNLTGYTMTGKIRRKFSDSAALVSLTCTITDIAGGLFTLSLTAVQTAALTVNTTDPTPDSSRVKSLGFFDVEITDGTVVTRILEGAATLSQEVTK